MSLAHDLARQHGGDWRGDHAAIPTPGHSKRDRGTILRDRADGKGVLVYSFNADWRCVRAALGLSESEARGMTAAERSQLERDLQRSRELREAEQLAKCAKLAGEGTPPEPGGPVRTYLAARGIPNSTAAQAVNAGALLEHRDPQGRVSMLALAHNRRSELRGVQLTKLRADGGGKRGTETDRLTFGPYRGAACRLFQSAGDTLAIAEGTETAMAFSVIRKVPTWSTFGTRNMEAFDPPAWIRTLIIAADGDRANLATPGDFKGLDAAEALLKRLRNRVRVIIAAAPADLDWLDVLNQRGAACR